MHCVFNLLLYIGIIIGGVSNVLAAHKLQNSIIVYKPIKVEFVSWSRYHYSHPYGPIIKSVFKVSADPRLPVYFYGSMQPDHEIEYTGTCATIGDLPYNVDPSVTIDLCPTIPGARGFYPKPATLTPVYLEKGEAYFTLLETCINENYSFYFNAGYEPDMKHATRAKLKW